MEATEQNGLQFEISATGTEAVDSFRKLANALNRMKKAADGSGLGKVNFELKALSQTLNKTNTAEPFHKLASALTRINKTSGGEGLREATIGLRALSQTVNQINTKKMAQLANALHQLAKVRGIKASARAAAKAADAVQNTELESKDTRKNREKDYSGRLYESEVSAAQLAKNSIGASAKWSDKFKSGIASIGIGTSKALSVASAAFAKFKPIAIAALRGVSSAANGFGKVMKTVFGTAMRVAMMPLNHFVSEVRTKFSELQKIGSKFLTVMLYRLIRSFIMSIQQGVKQGIQNLYQWSDALDGRFAKSMDRLTTSFQYLKNSIAAMVAPIVNALAPAIDFLVDRFVDLINIVNQFIARMTGASTWTRATKQAASYGDTISNSADKAGKSAKKAAKEFKAYLLGFDEINKPDKQADSSSGGSSGSDGGGTNYAGMFEEVATFNDSVSDFADAIKKKIEEGDWYGAGKLLGEKLNEVIASVDWNEFGHKIGEKIGHAIQLVGGFLSSVDFEKIGEAIGEFISGAIAEIDFTTLGKDIIARGFTMWGDMLVGLIRSLDFKEVGKAFGDLFRGIFEGLDEFITKYDWSEVLNDLLTGIIDAVKSSNPAGIITSFFNLIGDALYAVGDMFEDGGIADFVFDLIDEIRKGFENADKNKLAKGILKFIEGAFSLVGQLIGELAEKLALLVATGIGNWFTKDKDESDMSSKIGQFINKHIWGPFKKGIQKHFSKKNVDDAFAKMFEKVGEWIGESIANGIDNWFKDFLLFGEDPIEFWKEKLFGDDFDWVGAILGKVFGSDSKEGKGGGGRTSSKDADGFVKTHIWNPIKESFKNTFTESNVAKLWSSMLSGAGTAWENIKKTVKTKASEIWTEISTPFKNLASDIQRKWDEIKESASKAWEALKSGIKTTVSGIWGAITGAFNTLKTNVQNVWQKIQNTAGEIWVGMRKGIAGIVGGIWDAIKSALNSLSEKVNEIWSGISGGASSAWGSISGFFKDGINSVIEFINKFIEVINNLLGKLGSSKRIGLIGYIGGGTSSNYNYKARQANRLANGTPPVGSPTTAVVNDQRGPTYREAIVRSNGNVEIPRGRNVLTNLNKGDAVVPARQTKELFPHYATGVGDWLSNLAENLKGGGNITNAINTILRNVGRDTGSGLFNAMWDAIKGLVHGTNIVNIIKEHILDLFSSSLKVRQPLSFWRPYVIKSLEMNGLPTTAAYVNAWLSQINSESGGNPAAINLWDSNAKAGIPSKGLLQTIDPTFNAYKFKGYNDIWNGFHNMLAAMNYAKTRYGYSGMLRVIGYNHGYAKGGFPTEGELFYANENGIEMMGRMGNRNVVANNEQIIDGIAIGVANAVAAVMNRTPSNSNPVIDFTLIANNEALYKAVKQGKKDYENRYHVVEEW